VSSFSPALRLPRQVRPCRLVVVRAVTSPPEWQQLLHSCGAMRSSLL
jgi:hypothetical protein